MLKFFAQLYSVGEIHDACQIAAAAVPGRNRAKRLIGFADDVKPAPQPAGARGVHGEVAGILDRAFAHFLQVKRARPLQHHWGDLTVAFADMGLEPSRNVRRLLHGKRSGRTRQGDDAEADDSDDSWKERSHPAGRRQRDVNSPNPPSSSATPLTHTNPFGHGNIGGTMRT